jgi:SAM-dependent methyltransferase
MSTSGTALGVLRGLTLARIGMHELTKALAVADGDVLDLGAGAAPSYREHLQGRAARYVRVDGSAVTNPDAVVDLDNDPLPFADRSFDAVLAFNLLEHLYHPEMVLNEARRVLRPTGRVIVWVPFLVGYHPSPEDFFRYSESSLRRKFDDAGFESIEVATVGGRFKAAANVAIPGVPLAPLRAVCAATAVLLDRLYYRTVRNASPADFPLGYLVIARSPNGER